VTSARVDTAIPVPSLKLSVLSRDSIFVAGTNLVLRAVASAEVAEDRELERAVTIRELDNGRGL